MKSVVVVSSVLAAAGAAMAAPFNALSYEAGGGLAGIVGAGFTVSSGGFFTADGAGSNVTGGGAANFTTANEQEFDSHFSLDPFGPSARNRTLTPGNNSTATLSFYGDYGPAGTAAANYDELELLAGAAFVIGPGSHIGDPAFDNSNPVNQARAGIAVSPPPVPSTFAPNATGGRSAFDGVFVGRFTVQAGATLSGGIFFNTLVAPGQSFGADIALGGPAVMFNTHNGMQPLALRAYKIATRDLQNPSASAGDGESPFGMADVWDVWVQLVPAPGAVALFGLGGIAAIRRRRA